VVEPTGVVAEPVATRTRSALVTGAASGIGEAVAVRLAADGYVVVCGDLDGAGAARVAAGLPGATAVSLDVRAEGDWEAAIAAASSRAPVGVLAHRAGISAAGAVVDSSLADWQRVLATNLDGSFLAVRSGLRAMAESGGAIVVVGSASGIRAAAGAAAYSTSKAAVRMLVQVAAKECRERAWPVRVNLVSPAGVKTAMWRSMAFFEDLVAAHGSDAAAFAALAGPGQRFAEPEEVAAAVAFLASDAAQLISGVDLPIDAGYVL
jgi:NAD(P)-dependent dehydrogenase (short-subunit alcohol dehydrogenase family)